MNKSELEKILKAAPPPPERPPEFWEKLSGRITAQIQWRAGRPETALAPAPRRPMLSLGWALATACVIGIGIFIYQRNPAPASQDLKLAAAQKYLREIEKLFPNQVQAIVFDQNGPRLVLSEKADVPDSTPLYLKICGPDGCQQFVTFSGQRIRVNGDDYDVLLNAAGEILLVGDRVVWSSDSRQPQPATGPYRIEGHRLHAAS